MSKEEMKAIELLTYFYNKYKNIIDIVQNNNVQNDVKQTSDEFTNETRYYTPEGKIYKTIIETYKCPKNYISKNKIIELLKEIQKEKDKATKHILEKDYQLAENGAIAQELGWVEGKIQSLLEEN